MKEREDVYTGHFDRRNLVDFGVTTHIPSKPDESNSERLRGDRPKIEDLPTPHVTPIDTPSDQNEEDTPPPGTREQFEELFRSNQ